MVWSVLLPIILYLLFTFLVGGYFHKYLAKRKTTFQEEFFVGGRSLGPITLTFTLLATAASAGTFIGSPGVAYHQGYSWLIILLAQVGTGVYVLGILGKKFAIIGRRINAVTLTDFLKARYPSKFVVLGSTIGTVIFVGAYMVAQFVGGSIILQAATGLPYKFGLLLFGIVVVVYTTFGGFRAVAATDAIQGVVMVLGGVILWMFFLIKTEGPIVLIQQLATQYPEMVELPGPSGTTPLMLFSFFVVFGIAGVGLPHAAVRGLSFKDSKSMHRAIVYGAIIMGLFTIFFATLGPFTRVLIPGIDNTDMALPLLILELMPGWVAGIVLAAPLAAMMSTVDSMLLVTSSAIVKDIYINFINPQASDKKISKLSYFVTLIIGIFLVVFALSPPDYLQFIVVYAIGGLASAFFAPVIFGLYWKRSSTWGATASMYIGLISYVILSKWFPDPFGMNAIVTSILLSIVVLVVISYLTPGPSKQIINIFWGGKNYTVSNKSVKTS